MYTLRKLLVCKYLEYFSTLNRRRACGQPEVDGERTVDPGLVLGIVGGYECIPEP